MKFLSILACVLVATSAFPSSADRKLPDSSSVNKAQIVSTAVAGNGQALATGSAFAGGNGVANVVPSPTQDSTATDNVAATSTEDSTARGNGASESADDSADSGREKRRSVLVVGGPANIASHKSKAKAGDSSNAIATGSAAATGPNAINIAKDVEKAQAGSNSQVFAKGDAVAIGTK